MIASPSRRDDQAGPLPPTEAEAEEPLGEHGEEDQPGREDGLHDRQRRERKGADVKHPGPDRHQPAHREPLGAKELGGASQRVPNAHGRRRDRAALLEQEGDARRERAGQGERESDDHAGDRLLETRRVSHGRHGLLLICAELTPPTS